MKTNDNKLTVIIPSYCRQGYLQRAFRFWEDTVFRVIVVDGSPIALDVELTPKSNSNVTYFHRPVSWAQRLSFAASKVETKYVVMASDDEYYLPRGLESLVDFLDANEDYVACIGRSLGFIYNLGRVLGVPVYPRLRNYSVASDSAVARVVEHMGDYVMSLVWAVVRTPYWKLAADTYVRSEFRLHCQIELQFEMILSFAGKSRCLPVLTWMRSYGENESIQDIEPGLDSSSPMEVFWRELERRQEAQRFVQVMSSSFMSLGYGNNDYCQNAVVSACEAYCRFVESRPVSRARGLRYITGYLPPWLKASMRRGLQFAGLKKESSLFKAAKQLELEGVSVAFDEIDAVERSILDFHSRVAEGNAPSVEFKRRI